MNAAEVLATVEADGLELALRDGRLCVRPAGRIRRSLAELVRQHSQGLCVLLTESTEDSERERFEERAAIYEYKAGYSRQEAEQAARRSVGAYRSVLDPAGEAGPTGRPSRLTTAPLAGTQPSGVRSAQEIPSGPITNDRPSISQGVQPGPGANVVLRSLSTAPIIPTTRRAAALDDWGDMRPCMWCRNLARSGRCLAAWRGELRAARDYAPTKPDLPRRCVGYDPSANDHDHRPGRERWSDLVAWQAPVIRNEKST